MIRALTLSILLATSVIFATPALAGPDCTCRYKGKDVPEGQSACIKTANGYKMAQCAFVLNNTSWKFTKNACPIG